MNPLKVDARGRVTIGDRIAKNGIEPSAYYALSFGPNQTIILSPVAMVIQSSLEWKE